MPGWNYPLNIGVVDSLTDLAFIIQIRNGTNRILVVNDDNFTDRIIIVVINDLVQTVVGIFTVTGQLIS